MSDPTTFADFDDDPADSTLLEVWLAEIADALAEYGHAGEM